MLHVVHRSGRFEFQLDAIPPERAILGSNSLGLQSTQLSYLDATLRYRVTSMTNLGVGEMAYNQQSLYAFTYSSTAPGTLTSWHSTDRSRIVGMVFSAQQTLRKTAKSSVIATIALSPSLRGALGSQIGWTTNGAPPTVVPWFAIPEHGSQFDALIDNSVRINKRTFFHYGVRYLNMSMRFSDGSLADRNAFLVPFFWWSTTLGR